MNIKNSLGLSFEFLENGSLKCIEVAPVRISLKASTIYSRSGANLWLRKRTNPFEFIPLLGPESQGQFVIKENVFSTQGHWAGLDYQCVLRLSQKSLSWQWLVTTVNHSGDPVDLDVLWVQDVGLKPISDGLVNEYYVAQYLERRVLEDKNRGVVVCCRQNMKEPVGNPWLMMACTHAAKSASVDGMQFYGKTYRETGIPEGLACDGLGGEYAGESPVLALQEKPFTLANGERHQTGFVATYLPDHPEATSITDLNRIPSLMDEFEDNPLPSGMQSLTTPDKNLFNRAPFLPVDDLTDEELDRFFGTERRHREEENGKLLSFFCKKNDHVVLRAKEILVDRPHAHIMQAKTGFAPDENIMSTTAFAFGIFNSHLSQGNTNFNVLLSIATSPFNLEPHAGQRIMVEIEGRFYLLGVPSAFEIGLNHCRWIYKSGNRCFQVRTWTSVAGPQVNMDFKVIGGDRINLLVTHDFDLLNGWTVVPGSRPDEFIARPGSGSMIAGKFPQAQFRIRVNSPNAQSVAGGDEILSGKQKKGGSGLFVFDVQSTNAFCLSFIGEVCTRATSVAIDNPDERWALDCEAGQALWKGLSLNLAFHGDHPDITAIQEILPWYGMNALTHFLTPYGLEQFSGAAWGTRDIAQGPFDLLLAMEKYAEAGQVLRIIFSNQNIQGDWPQWWMFDSYFNIRAGDCHGDVYYWCIIALANYIKATGDLKILNEVLPYHHEKGVEFAEKTPLSEHIDRLIEMIVGSFIPGTALVPFGGGDWNDSLQPVSKELAQRMISSWTVEMNYQAFNQLSEVYFLTGQKSKAKKLQKICSQIKADFNKYLIRDGVVAGYGLVGDEGKLSLLLHPGDDITHIRYSILPMERGIISELFDRDQALSHQDLIEQYLKGPDGARLMDRPIRYKGGIQTIFQRAESSTFFGREIGLMYVHEHIRYAESQAMTGRADAFLKALRQAVPIAYRDVVACGDIRQSNCYYSSSDVVFKNRYEADERYDEIKTGKTGLKGGWRVYSSGPGIYIGILISRLFGLRNEFDTMIIDPVLTQALDGLSVFMDIRDRHVHFLYTVKEGNYSPKNIVINGKAVGFTIQDNKYRKGGAVIPMDRFILLLDREENQVEIQL